MNWRFKPASSLRPQLAGSRPVFAFHIFDDDVDRVGAAGEGRDRRFGHRFDEGALLFDRTALEQLNVDGWHGFSFLVSEIR
jgi:hypothetical protein